MSITTKLLLALVIIVVTVAVVSGYFLYRAEERQLLRTVALGADQLSRSVTSATWHAMLADRREDAYQVMETIAHKQGVDRFRLYNRAGVVTFSTDPSERLTAPGLLSESCEGCHRRGKKIESLTLEDRIREFKSASIQRGIAISTPIPNETACSQAACHAHPPGEKVLGVLEIRLDLAHIDADLADLQRRIAVRVVVEIVLVSILFFFFTRTFIRRPILGLIASADAISRMNLDRPIPIPRHGGEIEQLAVSFDQMRVRLRDALDEINQFTQKLEHKVAERTRELKLAHQKLIQSDRLSSLGQLSASVAHEINNPVAGILNLGMLMQRLLREEGVPPDRLADFRRYLSMIVAETSRVGRIVSDLLAFSRRAAPHRANCDVNTIVQSTLSLLSHKLALAGIKVEEKLAPSLPEILCDRSQIQQVIVNLVLNAAEAMHSRPDPLVTISTGAEREGVWLGVSDNGEGIPEEVLPKIFDPFFTTKPEGKGVGLGLAVTYGIVQAHGGEIEVTSRLGEGTSFHVWLPLKAPVETPPEVRVGAA
jgi:two-component system, NtrC family, sensor kinase